MYRQANYLTALIYAGLIWCVIVTIYSVGQYFALSVGEITIKALQPKQDVVIEKITDLLERNKIRV